MKKFFLFILFMVAGCQLPIEKDIPLSVDAYLRRIPAVKTAVIHLTDEDRTKNDIEYQQFFEKLKPVLETKGYRLTSPAAVILRLGFGVKKEASVTVKSAIDTMKTPHPADEPSVLATTQFNRQAVYEKFISLTAVQAGKEETPLWKTTVSLADYAPDFRSAQDKLLYLLSHFIERDSGRRIIANLSDAEFYQRYMLNYSTQQASPLFVTEAEMRRQYLKKLQARLNTHADEFGKCGLTENREVVFNVSAFGTLPAFGFDETFKITGTSLAADVRACLVKHFEPLLEPPLDLDTAQPMSAIIPVR